jgi:membrane protein implicated in regulation of membrane protease activity
MEWYWWLALSLILGVVEVLIVDLLFLMFAGGALAATIAAALGAPLAVQVAVFAIVSVLLLVAIRPWALRRFKKEEPETATNISALVGRSAVVLVATSAVAGRVKLMGEVWTARFDGAGVLPVGTPVEVVKIDGATAVVAPTDVVPGVGTADASPSGGYGSAPTGPAAPAYPPGYPTSAPPAQP